MLFLGGVYASERGWLRFRRVKAPEKAEVESLVHTVSERAGCYLERQGLLVRDMDNITRPAFKQLSSLTAPRC